MEPETLNLEPLHQQVRSLPDLVGQMLPRLINQVQELFTRLLCEKVRCLFLTGCGDSYHAGLGAELAFHQLAGLPCRAMPAMQFSRYTAAYLPANNPGGNLLITVSVSGQVSRTIEALNLGRQAGATTIALTGNSQTPLGQIAEFVLPTAVPRLPGEKGGMVVPGVRSYVASLLALYLSAIQIGAMRNHLTENRADQLRQMLAATADLMGQTINATDPVTAQLAQEWGDAQEFVYCGAGPNYGVAQFSAAKLLEASGDPAVGQEMEEWAHLQYFGRQANTPTFLISGGRRDQDRTVEIATAAKRIGRRVALIGQVGTIATDTVDKDVLLPTAGPIPECFSPLLTSLPGALFAAYRAQTINEPYFRAFGGGRSAEGGGGISRIRTSRQQLTVNSPDPAHIEFVTGGGLRVDYLIGHDGRAHLGLVGGNAVYAAVGAAIWRGHTGVWGRIGENYPGAWLEQLRGLGLATAGLKQIEGRQDHRTFFAYTPDGRREDRNPAAHFARIGQPMPPELENYVHSTPGQDDPTEYEPLALRPDDWPPAYDGVTAVHLSPLSICTHRDVPGYLRRRGVLQITADPGERYMVPDLVPHIRQFLPHLDAFLPSAQEVRSLFGATVDLWTAAVTLGGWGAPLVVIKNGAAGILLYERDSGRRTTLPAYHRPGDKRVVDVTGAGDAFCGGFMVGLARSHDPIQAARFGLVSASLTIEGYGALYALSRQREEAIKRLAIYNPTNFTTIDKKRPLTDSGRF